MWLFLADFLLFPPLPHILRVGFFWKVCLVREGENLILNSDANRRLGCGGGVKGGSKQ